MRRSTRGEMERTIFEATQLWLSRKLENDFTATLAACCVRNGRFRFAQWIGFLHFRLQQTAFRHFEQMLKRFHSLSRRRIVVPFVNPNAPEAEIFENEQAVR